MICKFCGNVIDDNSDFCFICGQKNPAEEVASAQENVKETLSAEIHRLGINNLSARFFLFCLSAAFSVFCLCIGFSRLFGLFAGMLPIFRTHNALL